MLGKRGQQSMTSEPVGTKSHTKKATHKKPHKTNQETTQQHEVVFWDKGADHDLRVGADHDNSKKNKKALGRRGACGLVRHVTGAATPGSAPAPPAPRPSRVTSGPRASCACDDDDDGGGDDGDDDDDSDGER
eukprot:47332-Rhodomonas_salina.1